MANGLPSPGVVPIRNYLRALGVPNELIRWDEKTGEVRVGNQTIRPAANVSGTTFAAPEVLQQVARAAPVAAPPPPPEFNPFSMPSPRLEAPVGLPSPASSAQRATSVLQQAMGGLRGLPLTIEAINAIANLTGRTPYSGAPTFTAQQEAADLFNTLAQTAGRFPSQVPEMAGQFAPLLQPFAGQITEERRSNLAQEALTREQIAVQRTQAEIQAASKRAEAERNAAKALFLQQLGQAIANGQITSPQEVAQAALLAGFEVDADIGRVMNTLSGGPDVDPLELERLLGSDPEYQQLAGSLPNEPDPQTRLAAISGLDALKTHRAVRLDPSTSRLLDRFTALAQSKGEQAAWEEFARSGVPINDASSVLQAYLYERGVDPKEIQRRAEQILSAPETTFEEVIPSSPAPSSPTAAPPSAAVPFGVERALREAQRRSAQFGQGPVVTGVPAEIPAFVTGALGELGRSGTVAGQSLTSIPELFRSAFESVRNPRSRRRRE